MTDKVQKIREEVERLRKSYQIMYQELDSESPELMSVCAKRNLCQDILMFIDSLQEEPVSEDLEEAVDGYLATYFGGEKEKQEWPFLKKMAIYFAEWQKEKMMKNAVDSIVHCDKFGVILPKEDLKKAVDNLPELQVYDKVKLLIIKED